MAALETLPENELRNTGQFGDFNATSKSHLFNPFLPKQNQWFEEYGKNKMHLQSGGRFAYS